MGQTVERAWVGRRWWRGISIGAPLWHPLDIVGTHFTSRQYCARPEGMRRRIRSLRGGREWGKKEDGHRSRGCGRIRRQGWSAGVRQGALSSAAVPMLAALPASDKLLLFMSGGGGEPTLPAPEHGSTVFCHILKKGQYLLDSAGRLFTAVSPGLKAKRQNLLHLFSYRRCN